MDATEFYRLRDDRTNACGVEPHYVHRRAALTIGEAAAATTAGQVAFLLAANLTARWCRRIAFDAPQQTLLGQVVAWSNESDLRAAAAQVARRADPFGDFQDGPASEDDWLRLHIGTGGRVGAFQISAEGWIALGGSAVREPRCDAHPLAGAMAACIGAAWLFRAAIGDDALPTSCRMSLWNLTTGAFAHIGPAASIVALGSMLMIGCGAIGSAIAYLLPIASVHTDVTTVDGDDADITNLNRSPLLTFDDRDANKAIVAASFLRAGGIPAREVPMWFDEALAHRHIFVDRPDLVIPAANERHVRHAIQHQVPPLMVYGTTSRDWQAFLGRHIPLREDCLACRFPERQPLGLPPMRCATGTMPVTATEPVAVDAALPFVSTAAAVLAVAEMIKLATAGAPINPNFACIDFRGALDNIVTDQRNVVAGCICGAHRSAWMPLNARSRFGGLSA